MEAKDTGTRVFVVEETTSGKGNSTTAVQVSNRR